MVTSITTPNSIYHGCISTKLFLLFFILPMMLKKRFLIIIIIIIIIIRGEERRLLHSSRPVDAAPRTTRQPKPARFPTRAPAQTARVWSPAPLLHVSPLPCAVQGCGPGPGTYYYYKSARSIPGQKLKPGMMPSDCSFW